MKLGSSFKVPHVQELAKESLSTIPSRYVHPDQDPPTLLSDTSSSSLRIPIIDLQSLLSGCNERSTNSELQKLHQACRDWGFFQLINHGVDSSLVEKVKSTVEDFFKLPLEKKKELSQEPGDIQGYGQAFVVSEDQRLDWGDIFSITTLPKHLRKHSLFSKLPLQFRETIEAYTEDLEPLAMKLLSLMATALGMKDEEMEVFKDGRLAMRMNYYPPCPQPELAIGLSPHSDGTGLTILLQINEMEGLQIKKDGIWIPIKPLPNAFIVNVGDMIEIVTNGNYRSIEHRATVNSEKERLSVAIFFGAKLDGILSPSPGLLSPETPPLFKTVTVGEFNRAFFTNRLQGKSHLDAMRIGSNSSGQS